MFSKVVTPLRCLAAAILVAIAPASHGFESSKPAGPSGNALHMKRFVETEIKDAFRHMVFQNDISLNGGINYKITFWARASKPLKMRITTKNSMEPWAFFGLREEVKLTNKWKRYEFTFYSEEPIPGETRLTFNFGEGDAGEIWIADLDMYELPDKAPKNAPRPKDAVNVIVNPQFQGIDNWTGEGMGAGVFLFEVQSLADVEAANTKK